MSVWICIYQYMLTYVGDYLCNMDNTNVINRKLLTELNTYIHTYVRTYIHMYTYICGGCVESQGG